MGVGLDDGAEIGGQVWVLLLAALPAARGEVLQAPHAVLLFVQSLLDRLASPAEASLDLAGAATAERRGHLGLEQAALVSGEASGPRPNQGVILLNGVVHHGGPAQGETMPDRPRSARYWGGQDSSLRGRFPAAGRLNPDISFELWMNSLRDGLTPCRLWSSTVLHLPRARPSL